MGNLGNEVWQKSFSGSGDEYLSDLVLAGGSSSDVSFDVETSSYNNLFDFWVVITNTSDFSIKSQFKYGGDQDEVSPTILELENNSFLLFGASQSDISGEKIIPSKGLYDFWILELSTDLSTENIQKEASLSIYPNPTSNTFQIVDIPSGENYQLKIIDMMGKSVLNSSVNSINNSVNLSCLSPGMYTLHMIGGSKRYASKLFLE